jgi:hypothetical protein
MMHGGFDGEVDVLNKHFNGIFFHFPSRD